MLTKPSPNARIPLATRTRAASGRAEGGRRRIIRAAWSEQQPAGEAGAENHEDYVRLGLPQIEHDQPCGEDQEPRQERRQPCYDGEREFDCCCSDEADDSRGHALEKRVEVPILDHLLQALME